MTERTKSPRDTLNLRIRSADRALIDQAAALTGKNRTDFVIDASRRAAEEALLDRTFFAVDGQAYDAFVARLDAAPEPSDALKKTFATKAPWQQA